MWISTNLDINIQDFEIILTLGWTTPNHLRNHVEKKVRMFLFLTDKACNCLVAKKVLEKHKISKYNQDKMSGKGK
jgi:hypothetical protein